MKVYKFYAPELEVPISNAFMPDYMTRLLGWTTVKKYRNWFVRSRLKGTFSEIVTEMEPDSDEWEELQVDAGDSELIPVRLKSDNNAVIGAVISRIMHTALDMTSMMQLQTNIFSMYDIKKIPEKMFTKSFQKDLYTLSYDILLDDTGDDFSIEAENIRDGDIPIFWHYLFMNYKYLDIDGMLEVSKSILKYLDSQEEEEE